MSDPSWLLPTLVGLPILAAVVPLLVGRRVDGVGWVVAAIVGIVHLAMAGALASRVLDAGPVVHELGGFPAPIGIVLIADELSALLVLLVGAVATGVLAYTRRGGPRGWSFYSVYLLLLAGLSGMGLTGDLFNLFVFLEITGIATYALIAARPAPPAAMAALKYLIVGTVGATFYLIGVGLLFGATGTLNMADMAASLAGGGSARLGVLYDSPLVIAGFGFIVAGLGTKIALFPLHTWQPDAYAEAHDGVSILVAALGGTTAAYALLRVVVDVFTVDFFAVVPAARWVLIGIGSVSVVAGSALAAIQRRPKRLFAYSSVSHLGLVVAAVGVAVGPGGGYYALLGAIVHLLGHAVVKGGLFAGAGVLAAETGARSIEEYAELGRRHPVPAATVAVLGLALVGVPPSVGFVGKWFIAIGALEAGVPVVAALVVGMTLLTLAYVARVIERLYVVPRPAIEGALAADGGGRSASLGMVAAAVVATVVAVGLGLLGGPFEAALAP
ncbi:MAG: proton-conducting transporter membrane subunit, partial [Halobacteriota archaeon]